MIKLGLNVQIYSRPGSFGRQFSSEKSLRSDRGSAAARYGPLRNTRWQYGFYREMWLRTLRSWVFHVHCLKRRKNIAAICSLAWIIFTIYTYNWLETKKTRGEIIRFSDDILRHSRRHGTRRYITDFGEATRVRGEKLTVGTTKAFNNPHLDRSDGITWSFRCTGKVDSRDKRSVWFAEKYVKRMR